MSATRMTCRDMVQFLMDYLSEELPDDTRTVFELHVNACPDCVTYLATYRETIVLAASRSQCASMMSRPKCPGTHQAILAAQKKIAGSA